MYPKILPEVRGGAQRAEGSVVEGKLLYYCQKTLRPLRLRVRKDTRDPRDTPETNNQHDFTDETVAMRNVY